MTISADDETFEAHKLILSACSPYFRSLLNRSPCRHPVIYLNDVSADHVATLLKYMYVGQIAVKKEVTFVMLKLFRNKCIVNYSKLYTPYVIHVSYIEHIK